MGAAIVATKLFVPPPRPGLVARAHLQRKFERALHGKLSLVSAPAGFGKSTLVAECAAASGRALAWLSLDEGDSEVSRFLRYLIAAAARQRPGFGEAPALMLEAPQPAPVDEVLAAVLNELAALMPPLLLVLDDYHLIDSGEVDRALTFLLEQLPPQHHVALCTREDPQLPLASWRAKGWVAEFRVAELRFSVDEVAAFFAEALDRPLGDDLIADLESRTEGWVAGLQLAALSLQGREDAGRFVDDFSGSHRHVLDYLVEEVLQRLDDAERDFLLQTSVLERLQGELCDAVTQGHGGAERLHALERSNLFLIALDDRRQWYRYHHLFRDVLQARWQQRGGCSAELHARASAWLAADGQWVAAVEHALEAGDDAASAALIERAWRVLRSNTPETVLVDWLARLPEAQIERWVALTAHYGMGLLTSDPARAEGMLSRAEAWLQAPELAGERQVLAREQPHTAAELPGLLAIARAYQAGAAGDLDGIVAHAERALQLLGEESPVYRGAAAALLGMAHWSRGELERAYTSMATGHASMRAAGELSPVLSSLYLLANLRGAQGRLVDAEQLCECGLELLREHGGVAPQGGADIHVALAAICLEWDQLARVEELLAQAEALGPQAQLLESRHLWHVVAARLAERRGDWSRALEQLQQAEGAFVSSPAPGPMPLAARRARVQLAAGDLAAVQQWAAQAGLTLESPLQYMREYEHLVLARLELARCEQGADAGRLQCLLGFVQRLKADAEAGGRLLRVVECDVLLARCLMLAGERGAALERLRDALAAAQPEDCRRLFLEEPALAPLLRELAPRDGFAAQLVGAAAPSATLTAAPAAAVDGLAEPLSERERDVLRRLHSELSGPEIAQQLFISLNTLRTHSKNIYAKLGVNSRRAAVKRAAELGLL